MQARAGYIKGIATTLLFGQRLSSAVEVAIECLNITIKDLLEDTSGTDEAKKEAKARFNKFTKEKGGLYNCMNKVLEEAAKSKTRNTGRH